MLAIATTPNADTPTRAATIAPVVAKAASPIASATTVTGWVSGADSARLSTTARLTPTSPRLISIGDRTTSGTRVTSRSRVAPPANAIANPTVVIPRRSNSSRIAFDAPTRANATSPIVFITANGVPTRLGPISWLTTRTYGCGPFESPSRRVVATEPRWGSAAGVDVFSVTGPRQPSTGGPDPGERPEPPAVGARGVRCRTEWAAGGTRSYCRLSSRDGLRHVGVSKPVTSV